MTTSTRSKERLPSQSVHGAISSSGHGLSGTDKFRFQILGRAKTKLIRFYKTAILPELALQRHTSGQLIREPCASSDYATATA